jgi:hypothetical protein
MEEEIKSTETSEVRKKISSGTKTFILGATIWTVFFVVIPIFIYLGVKDWIVALSITGKIGIGFIILGFILLGAVGTQRVTGGNTGKYIVDYRGSSPEKSSLLDDEGINYWEILSIGRVWMLLWGIIYLVPYAFDVPFML